MVVNKKGVIAGIGIVVVIALILGIVMVALPKGGVIGTNVGELDVRPRRVLLNERTYNHEVTAVDEWTHQDPVCPNFNAPFVLEEFIPIRDYVLCRTTDTFMLDFVEEDAPRGTVTFKLDHPSGSNVAEMTVVSVINGVRKEVVYKIFVRDGGGTQAVQQSGDLNDLGAFPDIIHYGTDGRVKSISMSVVAFNKVTPTQTTSPPVTSSAPSVTSSAPSVTTTPQITTGPPVTTGPPKSISTSEVIVNTVLFIPRKIADFFRWLF